VIVAYSAGTLVALEMAKALEEKGRIGKIIALDGAPALFSAMSLTVEDKSRGNLENLVFAGIHDTLLKGTYS